MKNLNLKCLLGIVVVLGLGIVILCQIGKNLAVNDEELWTEPPVVEEESELPVEIKTYQDALRASEVSKKPVLLIFHTENCRWCHKMKRDVLSDPDVKKLLDGYIVYYVDVSKEQEVVTKYGVRAVPAYVVINHEEKVEKSAKYKNKRAFISWLEKEPRTLENLRPNWW